MTTRPLRYTVTALSPSGSKKVVRTTDSIASARRAANRVDSAGIRSAIITDTKKAS